MGRGLKFLNRFLRLLPGRGCGRAVLSASETGSLRANNQDHVYVNASACVYAVADGMGGAARGEIASQIVCQRLAAVDWMPLDFDGRVKAASRALNEANGAILDFAREHGLSRMGTTAAVLLLDAGRGRRGAIVYIGDSRVYRVRGNGAEALTTDHTIGRELGFYTHVRRGVEGQAARLNHVLTRAIGIGSQPGLVTVPVDVDPADRFIVCSDGVHDVLTEEVLAALMDAGSLEDAREHLCSAVEKGGSPDNYSFVLVGKGARA